MFKRIYSLNIISFIFFLSFSVNGQNAGVIHYDQGAAEKYWLLNPLSSDKTYLLNNCGEIINEWQSIYDRTLTNHLDSDGSLWRSGGIASSTFLAGGISGAIEKFDWQGNLLWTFKLANDSLHIHHDFEVLPNGHFLVVAWELVNSDDLIGFGREMPPNGFQYFYSEQILEINPDNNFEVVWTWRALDHYVQDKDSLLLNYGTPATNPSKLDINLNDFDVSNYLDWLHINSIDYNEEEDLIVASCHGIDEIIILDHSTTKGDIIYRWGHPNNFEVSGDRTLFKQHDVQWIEDSETNEYNIMYFNNGRIEGSLRYSSVEEIKLNRNSNGLVDFDILSDPISDIIWSYNLEGDKDLYSKRMSGVVRLNNGHTLICEADNGRIIEVDPSGHLYWSYVNPVGNNRIFSVDEQPFSNVVFNVAAYDESYFDFLIKNPNFPEKIERDPLPCTLLSNVDRTDEELIEVSIFNGDLILLNAANSEMFMTDLFGKMVLGKTKILDRYDIIDLNYLPQGTYVVICQKDNKTYVFKVIMQN